MKCGSEKRGRQKVERGRLRSLLRVGFSIAAGARSVHRYNVETHGGRSIRRVAYAPPLGVKIRWPFSIAVEIGMRRLWGAFPAIDSNAAVIVEVTFGGTHQGVWAGIAATGKKMEVKSVLIFVFEAADLVCEKVYFDHATILRQLGASIGK